MHTTPDGITVVATESEAQKLELAPLLIIENLDRYLDSLSISPGPLSWDRIGDGQSNVTFKIERGGVVVVLRRGPRPPHPRSTHNMVREARIQQLVGRAGVPVPEIVDICEDESVLGVPFYTMGFLNGTVITDHIPPFASPSPERWSTGMSAIDELVKLHRVDVSSGPLATMGRPEGYLSRQVKLFRSLWDANATRSIPAVSQIGDWLEKNTPKSQAASIVHGDYRLGNIMFEPETPMRVSAILDWEMATIGDPLADLGYFIATYAVRGSFPTPLDLTPVTREAGYPSREDLIARYSEQSSLDLTDLSWYQALALWKGAIFCEEIYSRWLNGERSEDAIFGPSLKEGVPTLLRGASQHAGLSAVVAL
jgi:aminoglycoside phosphotransferase (APT) family kinase protein